MKENEKERKVFSPDKARNKCIYIYINNKIEIEYSNSIEPKASDSMVLEIRAR